MENPAATGLPEVDALPDGFVDSTTEPLGPPTPSLEHEDYRVRGTSEPYDPAELVEESGPSEAKTSPCDVEKIQKPRSFPVPLSETEKFDASLALSGENDGGFKGQLTSHSADSCPEALLSLPGHSEVKEQAPGKLQSSERCKCLRLTVPYYVNAKLQFLALIFFFKSFCCCCRVNSLSLFQYL